MRLCRTSISYLLGIALGLATCGCGSSQQEVATSRAPDGASAPDGAAPAPKKPVRDERFPEVVLETTAGPITVKLNAEKAPVTVRNFLAYVNSGHYDGTIFHQVDRDALVLGGGYTSELSEKKTQMPIRNEAHNGLKNRRGAIAMARYDDQVDSATSQFFINVSDNAALDHQDEKQYGYCVFGEVTAGLEVAEKISQQKTENRDKFEGLPVEPIAIRSAKRIR